MDQKKHWNTIANTYDDEVFDVFNSDKKKILPRYFKKHTNKRKVATDFGCGIGKAFPYLSPGFKHVLALDISDECIDIAKERGFTNITYKRADLTQQSLKLRPADFGLCCNVAILPELAANRLIIKTVSKGLRKSGFAIFVVPSVESMMYSAWQLVDWYRREGVKPNKIPSRELSYFETGVPNMVQGIFNINGVATKHYTASELHVLFEEAGMKITSLEKIEYDWNTEFDNPPSWLKAPLPWDWMVEAKKM